MSSSTTVALIAFACMFGSVLVVIVAREWLPEHHRDSDSRDVVKLGIGLLASLSALVLGLLTATAKNSYDGVMSEVEKVAATVISLDRVLGEYGPDAVDARLLFQQAFAQRIVRIWPDADVSAIPGVDAVATSDATIEHVQDRIRLLPATDEPHRWLQNHALELNSELAEARWLLYVEERTSLPTPFVIILIFWLSVIFASIGLFAPRNATVVTVLMVCSISLAGALFLIIELDIPFTGLIKIPGTPMYAALRELGK